MPGKSNIKKTKATKAKNAKKTAQKKTLTAPVEAALVEAAPVVAAPVEAAPVEAAPVVQTAGATKKPKKAKKAKNVVVETEQVTEAFTETATATTTETPIDTETAARRTRSFKVLLPNSSDYEGRFTGLTPYQAANKALSKYYRETNKPQKEITFSIKESTRGSKRGVYTYNGRREKLDTPVEYSIKDGRTITKHYKNRLTKIKKAEAAQLTTTATASA